MEWYEEIRLFIKTGRPESWLSRSLLSTIPFFLISLLGVILRAYSIYLFWHLQPVMDWALAFNIIATGILVSTTLLSYLRACPDYSLLQKALISVSGVGISATIVISATSKLVSLSEFTYVIFRILHPLI